MNLVELIVVLLVLSVAGSVAGVAWRVTSSAPEEVRDVAALLEDLRREARETGKAASGSVQSLETPVSFVPQAAGAVTVWPDGRVLIDSVATSAGGNR